MKKIDITEAQDVFCELIEQAADGQQILITKDGKPIARILSARKPRIGLLPGVYPPVPDDIDTPFAKEIEDMFYGKEE